MGPQGVGPQIQKACFLPGCPIPFTAPWLSPATPASLWSASTQHRAGHSTDCAWDSGPGLGEGHMSTAKQSLPAPCPPFPCSVFYRKAVPDDQIPPEFLNELGPAPSPAKLELPLPSPTSGFQGACSRGSSSSFFPVPRGHSAPPSLFVLHKDSG